jgi:mRNA-degrading endonuclease RelE of RelBE toxin-antitoxin system
MRIRLTDKAIRQYKLLPPAVQKKADKQFTYLLGDLRHPSLHIKKYQGVDEVWQGRIDKSWRFYFHIIEPDYIIISIITHPK